MVILLDGTFSNNLLEFTAVQVGLLSRTVHACFKCTNSSTENIRNLFLNNQMLENMVLEFRNIILIRRIWLPDLQKIFPNKNFHLFQNIFGYANDQPNDNVCKQICCRPPTVDDSQSNVTIQKFAVFILERIFNPDVFASLLCYKGGISNPLHLPPPLMMPTSGGSSSNCPAEQIASTSRSHPRPLQTRSVSYGAFADFQIGLPEEFVDIHQANCANTLDELIGMIDDLKKEDLEANLENNPFLLGADDASSAPNSNLASSGTMSPFSPISPVTSRYVSGTLEKGENEPLDLRCPSQ